MILEMINFTAIVWKIHIFFVKPQFRQGYGIVVIVSFLIFYNVGECTGYEFALLKYQ